MFALLVHLHHGNPHHGNPEKMGFRKAKPLSCEKTLWELDYSMLFTISPAQQVLSLGSQLKLRSTRRRLKAREPAGTGGSGFSYRVSGLRPQPYSLLQGQVPIFLGKP